METARIHVLAPVIESLEPRNFWCYLGNISFPPCGKAQSMIILRMLVIWSGRIVLARERGHRKWTLYRDLTSYRSIRPPSISGDGRLSHGEEEDGYGSTKDRKPISSDTGRVSPAMPSLHAASFCRGGDRALNRGKPWDLKLIRVGDRALVAKRLGW